MIPGIMLAAGASTRFAPAHKLLMPYREKTVIHQSVQAALETKLTHVIVVTGYMHQEIKDALDEFAGHPKLELRQNSNWKTGRASSLRVGLKTIPTEAEGFLAYPADIPRMTSGLINDVIQAFDKTRQLCFPVYNQRKGHPVAFPIEWKEELSRLDGGESGFQLIEKHWDEAVKLERTDVETQLNLNTKEDYEALLRG